MPWPEDDRDLDDDERERREEIRERLEDAGLDPDEFDEDEADELSVLL